MPIEKEPQTGLRILNATLDEDGSKIVLRGVIDPDHLGLLKVDDYQRARFGVSKTSSIWKGLEKNETLPDIELGMRGNDFVEVPDSLDIILKGNVYLIDGLQRVTTAMAFMEDKARDVRLGATVHFNTTREWEMQRFDTLNSARKKVSPNVLLRNRREQNPAILTLYGLSNADKDFPLFKKVSWGQTMSRDELVTGMTLARTSISLHRHISGTPSSRTFDSFSKFLLRLADRITLQQFRENVKTFYELVELCWGIRSVQYGVNAIWLRGEFQSQLALVLSDHKDFWDEKTQTILTVPLELRKKIASFPVFDPSVANLAGASGNAGKLLYGMMLTHINSGKRTRRLINRSSLADELEARRDARLHSEAANDAD